jgi:alpha-L-rhamnosidase
MPEEADGPNVFMLLDVGQNFAGRLELNVTGPAGAVVHLTYGELLSLDGSLNPMTSVAGQIKSGNGGPCAPRVAVQTDLLLLGAEGTVRGWRGPRFGWHGFRYALVNATAGVHITGVRAWGMRSAVASAWHFNSSSAVLNGASAMAQNTLDANLMGTQSDCPHRERFGYGGDLLGTSKGGMALHDMRAMYSARLQDFVDATDPLQTGGGVPETAPYGALSFVLCSCSAFGFLS